MYRKNAAFLLRIVVFTLIFALLSHQVLFVLTPKYDYGSGSLIQLYRERKNTVDVLAVGTSMTYAGVNTNVLWANWGMAAYDLGSAEQQYWHTYYVLREALRYQTPKVIVLDAKAATYPDDHTSRGRIIMSTHALRDPLLRIAAVRDSNSSDAMSYILGYPQVHNSWKMLGEAGFALRSWRGDKTAHWKGFVENNETEAHTKPSLVWTQTKRPLNEREAEYFVKICELARDHGIALLVVAYPNPDYEAGHMFYNSLWALAEEQGVPYINFNDPAGHYRFRYTTEFADWQHVNTLGSLKLSKLLGAYLSEHYDLPDHRGEAAFTSWQLCMEEFLQTYPQYTEQIYVEEAL